MTMQAQEIDGTMTVLDTDGGRWFPNEDAASEIDASADPEATALHIASAAPMRGEWKA